jgi:hypothetical protein
MGAVESFCEWFQQSVLFSDPVTISDSQSSRPLLRFYLEPSRTPLQLLGQHLKLLYWPERLSTEKFTSKHVPETL